MNKTNKTIAVYYFTYNRLKVARECFDTSFSYLLDLKKEGQRQGIDFSIEINVFDDGSEQDMRDYLNELRREYRNVFDKFSSSFKDHSGYSVNYFEALLEASRTEPDYLFLIETDYIFRKNSMIEIAAVLESLSSDNCLGVNGFSHPEFHDSERINKICSDDMIKKFGIDVNREGVYRPFSIQIELGNLKIENVLVQRSTHSCGTMFLNWKKIIENPHFNLKDLREKGCKDLKEGTVIDDGYISSYLTYLNLMRGIDKAALIDICDYSVADHIAGDGVNGKGIAEGNSHVHSPCFPENYREFERP